MDMELADRLYVFCPDFENGIEFILQDIPPSLAHLIGTLGNGKFLTSGYKSVEWDEKINGNLSSKTIVGHNHATLARVREGEYGAKTIVLDKQAFVALLMQMKNPKTHTYNNYKLFEIPRITTKDKNKDTFEKIKNNIK